MKVAESFINQYLDKCKNKDYSEFTDFTISKRIEKELNTEREKACLDTESVKIVSFDSAHILDYAKQEDPVELFVFNINNEKDPTLRYISTWVYHDKNVIGGLWVSKEKPLYRKKKKQASEKTK